MRVNDSSTPTLRRSDSQTLRLSDSPHFLLRLPYQQNIHKRQIYTINPWHPDKPPVSHAGTPGWLVIISGLDRPFKRKAGPRITKSPKKPTEPQASRQTPSTSALTPTSNVYPNPGFLGRSSHVAIFKKIQHEDGTGPPSQLNNTPVIRATDPASLQESSLIKQAAEMLNRLLQNFQMTAIRDLVLSWLARGTNLALAEPFVERCANDIPRYISSMHENEDWNIACAWNMLKNSCQPLLFLNRSFSDYMAQFVAQNVRWEALGIFCSAAIRASIDTPFFPKLYTSQEQKRTFQKCLTTLGDSALGICVSLDCLNDLQLILQYENFIVHSYIDGDQSYHSWRKLGDVIASLFALGYHEELDNSLTVPAFITELRKTAFARTYSADKNLAIFLGRPPRMSRRFCHFQIPADSPSTQRDASIHIDVDDHMAQIQDFAISYSTETRWSALCALLKEEILELLYVDGRSECMSKISIISARAESQWQSMPASYKLESTESLRNSVFCPLAADFMISARLNHLHILFLLRIVPLDQVTEPDNPLIEISQEMLALVVETLLLRDRLINSGTSLVWRTAYYGLPAAGMILLAMIKQSDLQSIGQKSHIDILRYLNVLVAEIQLGTLVKSGEPNYVLFSKAAQTIDRFLHSIRIVKERSGPDSIHFADTSTNSGWSPYSDPDLWDFEAGFWDSLAEHPFLSVLT